MLFQILFTFQAVKAKRQIYGLLRFNKSTCCHVIYRKKDLRNQLKYSPQLGCFWSELFVFNNFVTPIEVLTLLSRIRLQKKKPNSRFLWIFTLFSDHLSRRKITKDRYSHLVSYQNHMHCLITLNCKLRQYHDI